MLTPQEALLFQAVRDEEAAQMQAQAATFGGAAAGSLLGATAGTVPHNIGNALNALRGRGKKTVARTLKPGWRMAGGLTGLMVGGGLGAGVAAVAKQDSPAAQLLGKLQAQGGQLSTQDEMVLGQLLGEIYNNPSQLM